MKRGSELHEYLEGSAPSWKHNDQRDLGLLLGEYPLLWCDQGVVRRGAVTGKGTAKDKIEILWEVMEER